MIVYQDTVGVDERSAGRKLSSLEVLPALTASLKDLFGDDIALTPPQVWALDNGLLEDQHNLLVCAPTNSGKTLIGILKVFRKMRQGE